MKCKLCQNDDLVTIHTASDIPVFQNKIYKTINEAKNVILGNVKLVKCSNCGFVFNTEFDNKAIDCHIINFTRRSEEAVLKYCDERTTQ